MVYDTWPGECLKFLKEGQPVVVMQYIGLRDKNGREIYDGDILGGYPHGTAVVEWDTKYACWAAAWMDHNPTWDGEDDSTMMIRATALLSNELDDCKDAWEVIGNVHEHPELIP
jgi:uncharacterized phage protein (TIGR01671 family)